MSMSSSLSMKVGRVSDRASAYGMPGITVDGNDVQEVFDATSEAVAMARAGGGPTLIEAETYRYKGHSKSDQNLYRTREEIDQWRKKDPIGRFETALLEASTLSQSDTDAVRAEVRDAIRAASPGGNEAAPSRADELLSGVFAPVGGPA
jgi:TPP-dependent pyruvate/acetoin dehydrogenase alpha subunit